MIVGTGKVKVKDNGYQVQVLVEKEDFKFIRRLYLHKDLSTKYIYEWATREEINEFVKKNKLRIITGGKPK